MDTWLSGNISDRKIVGGGTDKKKMGESRDSSP